MCKYEVIVSAGDEVVFIFKFNCSSGKCSVILQNLPSELPLNILGFINNYPACRPAALKKFLQSQLGKSSIFIAYDFTGVNEGLILSWDHSKDKSG